MIFRGEYRAHYESTAYYYSHGSWDCIQSIPYHALEYATSCIRAADGCFRLLASSTPNMARTKEAFYPSISEIVSSNDIFAILSATSGPPPAGCWMVESSKLCVAMFKNFADPGRDKVVLANFLRWASGPIPARQDGVNFENKYFSISVEEGEVGKMVCERKPKSPCNNCYVTIPVEIQFQLPEGAIRRMRIFLETTFSGQDPALEMLLSYMALVASSVRLPEVMMVLVGHGGEGKTLLMCDLMGAVWGTGHAVAPPSILQTSEEFRKQGHIYRGKKWISIDESRPAIGIEEEVFKIFVAGGELCLRRNHEAETHFACWPTCGKTWCMNPDDIPNVPSAMESAYERRLRCVVLRSKFTQDPAKVCQAERTYLADDTLKDWLRGPEASCVFWVTVLMPFIRKSTRSECEARVKIPNEQVSMDTDWLRRKMARIGNPDIPPAACDGVPSQAIAPADREASVCESVVRETHIAALETDAHMRDMWSGAVGKLPRIPSNIGVKVRKSPQDRRPTKTDILDAAIAQFPYLLQKIDGQLRLGKLTHKYRFRQLYVDRYESLLSRISADSGASVADMFGTWADWGSSWSADRERRFVGEMPPHVGEKWSADQVSVCELVNIDNLRRYALSGQDRRPEQLAEFIRLHEAIGELGAGGGSKAAQYYARKIICGREMGRMYARQVSMQTVTREAREAACMEGYLELDITNCFPSCILLLYPEKDIREVRKYVENTPLWRRAVADYYDINIADAKEVLMCAMYGFPTPRNSISPSPHTLPFVEWLAEDVSGLRGEICRRSPDLLNHFAKNNRANAEANAFFYIVSQKEHEVLDLNFQKPDFFRTCNLGYIQT